MYVCVFVVVSLYMRARRATIASAMFTASRLLMDEGLLGAKGCSREVEEMRKRGER